MDEFGRRFCHLVAGTTLGTVLDPLLLPDSTSVLAYAAAIVASVVFTATLFRSRWLDA